MTDVSKSKMNNPISSDDLTVLMFYKFYSVDPMTEDRRRIVEKTCGTLDRQRWDQVRVRNFFFRRARELSGLARELSTSVDDDARESEDHGDNDILVKVHYAYDQVANVRLCNDETIKAITETLRITATEATDETH